MARILGLFPSSLAAAKGGMTANAYYRELRALGMAARRSEVLALYKISLSIVAKSPEEPFRPISEVPKPEHLVPFPTKSATGVRQNVTLVYRNRVTGSINRTYWSVTSENGITRENALATAIDTYSPHAADYGQDLIGAVHTGAYSYQPFQST